MTEKAPVEEAREVSQDLEEYPPARESGYWGSVRFFKHLILTVLALAILIPTTLSVVFGLSLGHAKNKLLQLQQTVSEQQTANQQQAVSQQQATSGQTALVSQTALISRVSPGQAPEEGERRKDSSQLQEENSSPEFPAYQKLYPKLYAQPHKRNSIDREKTVYLTFDDGPSARTPELLKILDEYGIKATFFVVGSESEEASQWMRDILAAGHTLGIHTYSQ